MRNDLASNKYRFNNVYKIDLLPVKSIAVGLEDTFAESILCKSGTNSDGIEENASLDK